MENIQSPLLVSPCCCYFILVYCYSLAHICSFLHPMLEYYALKQIVIPECNKKEQYCNIGEEQLIRVAIYSFIILIALLMKPQYSFCH